MHSGFLAAAIVGLFCLSHPGRAETLTNSTPAPTVPGGSTNTNAGGTNSVTTVIDAETRELKPHDVFRYRIDQDPSSGAETMRVTVTDSGEAHFNVSRAHSAYVTVKAAGRHLADVRKDLKEKLDAEYYRDASVKLDLEGVNAGPSGVGSVLDSTVPSVTVYGEMQGRFPVPEGKKVMLSDVMLGMGKNDFANLKKIKIQRINASGQAETHIVNVDKVLKDNDRSADFEVKDGDRIFVPRRSIVGF